MRFPCPHHVWYLAFRRCLKVWDRGRIRSEEAVSAMKLSEWKICSGGHFGLGGFKFEVRLARDNNGLSHARNGA